MNRCNRLRIAILQQAVKDYQTALRKKDTDKAASLERWFRSDWGQLLSDDKGELIISECRIRVKEKTKRPNRLAINIDGE